MPSNLLCAAVLACLAVASATRFSVVSFPADGERAAVRVGGDDGKITPLSAGSNGTVWSGDADAEPGDTYSYVIIDESGDVVDKEEFRRTLRPSWKSKTPNEVFGRSKTLARVPPLPQAYDPWPHGSADALFSVSYVPTVHVTLPGVAVNDVYVRGQRKIFADVTFVAQDRIFVKEGVNFSVSGKSSRLFRKQQLTLTFSEVDKLEGRVHLKFRAACVDPSFLRERVYTDVVASLGIPAQMGAHVRMYVNKEFFGLYFMIDGVDAAWASEVVAAGGTPQTLIKTNAESRKREADLAYRGDSSSDYVKRGYAVLHPGNNPPEDPMADCVAMIKQLDDFDPETASEDQLNELQALIDFDLVYRHAALEFLALHWDGSWRAASNYFLTKTNEGKWFISPTDYDHSFGTFVDEVHGGIYANYKEWTFPVDDSEARRDRPLFDKTLAHPVLKAKFERILEEIVQRVFHRAALAPRLEALHDLLREDVAADRNPDVFSPPKRGAGKVDFGWTVEHFDVLYKSGPEGRKHLLRPATDCDHGILSFTKERADIVAAQLDFSYDDAYTPPEDAYDGDNDAGKQVEFGKTDEPLAEVAGAGPGLPGLPAPPASPSSSLASGATDLACSATVAGLLGVAAATVIDH